METFDGKKLWAKYTTFAVGDENSGYKLTVGGFSGNAGTSYTKQMKRFLRVDQFRCHDFNVFVSPIAIV